MMPPLPQQQQNNQQPLPPHIWTQQQQQTQQMMHTSEGNVKVPPLVTVLWDMFCDLHTQLKH
ncbi:hypothetical protein Hanom_Chr10g00930331 [Helianthus anomalus]